MKNGFDMNRRKFLERIGATAGVVVCAPMVVMAIVPEKAKLTFPKPKRHYYKDLWDGKTGLDTQIKFTPATPLSYDGARKQAFSIDEAGQWHRFHDCSCPSCKRFGEFMDKQEYDFWIGERE